MGLLVTLAPACNGESTASPQAQGVTVTFATARGDVALTAELAQTPHARQRGLMHRKALEPSHGMVFVFPSVDDHTFWMKDTLISLDMIFVGDDLRVAGVVHEAEPLTLTSRSVGRPSLYVVEAVGGFARRHGIDAGTKVTFAPALEPAAR